MHKVGVRGKPPLLRRFFPARGSGAWIASAVARFREK
jgi:hypothetical protein